MFLNEQAVDMYRDKWSELDPNVLGFDVDHVGNRTD